MFDIAKHLVFPTLASYLALFSKQPTALYQTIFILISLDKLLLRENNWIFQLYHTQYYSYLKILLLYAIQDSYSYSRLPFFGHCMHTIHKMQWFMSKERPKWVVKYLWIDFPFSYVSLSFFYFLAIFYYETLGIN